MKTPKVYVLPKWLWVKHRYNYFQGYKISWILKILLQIFVEKISRLWWIRGILYHTKLCSIALGDKMCDQFEWLTLKTILWFNLLIGGKYSPWSYSLMWLDLFTAQQHYHLEYTITPPCETTEDIALDELPVHDGKGVLTSHLIEAYSYIHRAVS